MLWKFESKTPLSGLSLVVGIAITNALRAYGVVGIQLKWPNDIMYLHRKLGGILIETSGDGISQRVIIGIGLNVFMADAETATAQIDQPWIDIQTIIDKSPSRNKLAALIIQELFSILHRFQQEGFTSFMEEWQSLDMLYGKELIVYENASEIVGRSMGVDVQGRLLIQNDKQYCFSNGEVSIRLHK